MNKIIKRLSVAVAAIVILLILAAFSLPLLINPNNYKEIITNLVREKTGRILSIPGDIKLHVSPSLNVAFSLGQVSLSSGRNFPDKPFISSRQVETQLALWPLLTRKQLRINHITLEGVNVHLLRNARGLNNWDDLVGGGQAGASQRPAEKVKKTGGKSGQGLAGLDVGGISATDINVEYVDKQTARTIKLNNLNLEVGRLRAGRPFPVKAVFDLSVAEGGQQSLAARIQARTELTLYLSQKHFVINDLKLQGLFKGAGLPAPGLTMELTADADLNREDLTIKPLHLKIDDTIVDGTATVTNLKKPSYNLALQLNQLDLDQYRAKQPAATRTRVAGPQGTTQQQPVPGLKKAEKRNKEQNNELIPVHLLRGLNFTADIKVGSLKAAGMTLSKVRLRTSGKEGRIRLDPLAASLYDGTLLLKGDIDVRPDVPQMRLTEKLEGVRLGPLFRDMTGREEVTGKADIQARIATRGLTEKELVRHADGTVSLTLADGKIARLQILQTIRAAKALIDKKTVAAASSRQPTGFAKLTATGILTNGVLRNDDLRAESELMAVKGKGTVDLVKERIDYLLTIYLTRGLDRNRKTGLVDLSKTPIPYRVRGSFTHLRQSAALEEILINEGKKALINVLQKQTGKNSKNDAGALIDQGLKSIFGN